MRFKVQARCVARIVGVGTVVALASATPAHAQLGGIVKKTTSAVSTAVSGTAATALPSTGAVLSGDQGLLPTASQLLCPTAQSLADILNTPGLGELGVGTVGQGLATLTCSAGLLEYRFETTFRRADGTTVSRTTPATIGVPTALNVDDDVTPDLLGTISFTGSNSIGLTINRAAGETATLPVSVQAVLHDRTRKTLGRTHLAFGYDARHDRAPGAFTLSTAADTVLRPDGTYNLTVAQQQRGSRIALTAGIFDGTYAVPVNPTDVRLDYGASPDTATISARVGDEVSASLAQNRVGPATLSGRVVDGLRAEAFSAAITDLPASLNMTARTGEDVSATYNASATVSRIRAAFTRLEAGTTRQKAVLNLDDVPTGFSAAMDDGAGTITTTGGALGVTEIGIANGEPRFLDGEPAYVNADDDGLVGSTALRIPGLERATFTIGDAPSISAKIAATPLLARVHDPARTISARVDQLPDEFDLTFDLDAGRLDFDGKGTGIDRVTLTGDGSQPIFGRATTLRGTLEGIPARTIATLDAGNGRGGVTIEGGGAIGKVELVASNGDLELPAGEGDGAIYRDVTGGEFLVAARVHDLREVRFDTSGTTQVRAVTRGGPFSLGLRTDDVDADGEILDLPADATLGLGLEDGQITFDGADADGQDAGIELLTLQARLAQPLLGSGDRIKARIERLPAHVTLGFAQDSGGASLTADQPIRLIELQAWEDGKPEPEMPADQGAILRDRPGQDFELAARVRELKALRLDLTDAIRLRTETAGGLFTADIDTQSLRARATIDQLPTVLDLGLDLDSGRVTYSGAAPVDRISVDLGGDEPLFLGGTDFAIDLLSVPTAFALTIGQDLDESILLETDQPIGQIDVSASSPGREAPVIPDGEAGAKLDSTDGKLGLALRVFDLRRMAVDTAPIALEATMRPGTPFRVDAKLDSPDGPPAPPLHVLADIENLPASFRVALADLNPAGSETSGGTKLEYSASNDVGRIRIKADGVALLEGADGIEAELGGVPRAFTLALPDQPQTGPKPPLASLTVGGGQAIGELRLAAGGSPMPATGQPDDLFSYNGDPAAFGVAVRLTGLSGLSMNLDPVNLVLDQVPSTTKPITLDASLPQEGGDPATVTGVLDKPTGHTEVGVVLPDPDVTPAQPTRLQLRNGTAAAPGTMGRISLNLTNLGSIPAASFSLTNIARALDACLATDGACRPADRLPSPLSDYVRSNANVFGYRERPDTTQSGTAGGQNRPYAAQVSMDFNDLGTSGNGSSIGSMTTMNATIDLGNGGQPVQVQNVRFHRLALDFGMPGTTFSYLGQDVPRLYLFVDSVNRPFVLNKIAYPPTISDFRLGTDSDPAVANRRLVWLPGRKSGGAALDPRATGSLDCGGGKSLKSDGIDLLNFPLVGQLIPVCG